MYVWGKAKIVELRKKTKTYCPDLPTNAMPSAEAPVTPASLSAAPVLLKCSDLSHQAQSSKGLSGQPPIEVVRPEVWLASQGRTGRRREHREAEGRRPLWRRGKAQGASAGTPPSPRAPNRGRT